MAVYLPIVVGILCFYSVITAKDRDRTREAGTDNIARNQSWRGLFTCLDFLARSSIQGHHKNRNSADAAFSRAHGDSSGGALRVLVAKRENHAPDRPVDYGSVHFTATWSALKEVRVLYLSHESVLEEVMSHPELHLSRRNRLVQCPKVALI